METEKTCHNCKDASLSKLSYPCNSCTNYSFWYPQESLTKEYMERCLPGESAYDVINKPKHYMLFENHEIIDRDIEVRDVIEKLVSKMQIELIATKPLFAADYVQLMQYLMRFMDKNGLEDLKKARFYLDKLIESY